MLSNRLPITHEKKGAVPTFVDSTGGLVAALGPVLRKWGGVWIGWPGVESSAASDRALSAHSKRLGYRLHPVSVTKDEQEKFYYGFSNEIIWPLFHDLQTFCNFKPEYWDAYQNVNAKFAREAAKLYKPGDYLWVQDYHLMHVAHELRAMRKRMPIGFFLHIPFPPPDIFLKLPWRRQVIEALLNYDLVGFQTPRDELNFINCVQVLLQDVTIRPHGTFHLIERSKFTVRVGSFPIGVDAAHVASQATQPDVEARAKRIHVRLPNRQFILGVDRLDYTKGIPSKLRAFRRALERFPELHQKVSLIQILSPSRENIPRYNELKMDVERLVGRINGQFTESGWVPIHYIYRNLDEADVLAWYRASHIALVTPLKDGMNLVAKEFVAAKGDEPGVLILSEFAGAAAQLASGALLVNPYNLDEMAEAMHAALMMDSERRLDRMRSLRKVVHEQDVFWWVDAFLRAADVRRAPPSNGKHGAVTAARPLGAVKA